MMRSALLAMYIFGMAICLISCKRQEDPINAFISNILNENTERIYKSEIHRARVNLSHEKGVLIYSFWKREQFDKNGSLFLHAYLRDSTQLPERRKKYGFLNLSIKPNEIIQIGEDHFYVVKPLKDPEQINYLVTGQYLDKKRSWYVSAHLNIEESNIKQRNSNSQIFKNLKKGMSGVQNLNLPTNRAHANNGKYLIKYLIELNSQQLFKNESGTVSFFKSLNKRHFYTMQKASDETETYAYEIIHGSKEVEKYSLDNKNIVRVGEGSMSFDFSEISLPEKIQAISVYEEKGLQRTKIFEHLF
jgi:hypothetical protein